MAHFPHIACCIDDSSAAAVAIAEARRLRDLEPGRLTLVHAARWPLGPSGGFGGWVPDRERLVSAARDWLAARAAEVPGAETALVCGHPPAAVCEWAEEARPDLLVVASHRGAVERALLGSFAAFVAHHAPCPVLLVRPAGG
ncbi:MAG: universal stress protein [Thermoleophilia bacterium]|jgi:nucleotide-binding universal stress UspA family protein|nr:universal stress protein [Thermoleophilia bacterium]